MPDINLPSFENLLSSQPDLAAIHKITHAKWGIRETFEFNVENDLSTEECEMISKWIIEENKRKEHMLPLSTEKIQQYVNSGKCVILKHNGTVCGFVKAMPVNVLGEELLPDENGDFLEIGSLIIDPKFRGFNISIELLRIIFNKFCKYNIYLVTEVPQVMKVMETLHMPCYSAANLNDLSPEFKDNNGNILPIEGPGKLRVTDVVYLNPKMDKFINSK